MPIPDMIFILHVATNNFGSSASVFLLLKLNTLVLSALFSSLTSLAAASRRLKISFPPEIVSKFYQQILCDEIL